MWTQDSVNKCFLGFKRLCTPGYLEEVNHTGFLSSPQFNLLKCFVWCLGLTKVWWGHLHDTEWQFFKWKTRMINSRNSDFSVLFCSLVVLWTLTVLGMLSLPAYLIWSKGGIWSGFAFWTLGYFTQSEKIAVWLILIYQSLLSLATLQLLPATFSVRILIIILTFDFH